MKSVDHIDTISGDPSLFIEIVELWFQCAFIYESVDVLIMMNYNRK